MKVTAESARKHLVWSAVALAAGLAFLPPFPTGSQYQRHWAVAAAFAILLGAVALVVRGLDRDGRPRKDPVLIALGCLAGVFMLQLIPFPAGLVGLVSPARAELAREAARAAGEAEPGWLPLTACLKCTRDSILLLAAVTSVFYAASRFLSSEGRWKIVMGAAVAAGAILAVYGFAQVAAERARLTATYTNANRFAGLMSISGAAAVGLFISEGAAGGGRRPRDASGLPRGTVWLAAAAVAATALVLTLSRLGIASALAAGLLTVALFTRRRRALWAAFAAVMLLLAANAALAADPVLARYSVLFESERLGSGRPQCWAMALPLLGDFPVFGSGAGTFKHVFPVYQDPSLGGWWDYAHNDYLNLLADAGVLGLAAMAAAVFFLMKRTLELRSSKDPATRGIATAAFLALAAALFHSIGDYPIQQPANAIMLSLICGIAYGRALRRSERKAKAGGAAPPARPLRWVLPVRAGAAFVVCLVALPVLVRLGFSGGLRAKALRIDVGEGKEVEAPALARRIELLERAAGLDAWDARARYEAARARIRLVVEGAPADEAQGAVREAGRELREGRATSPLDPRPYYLGAVIAWRPDSMARADRMMLFALRLAPAWPDVAWQVGRYFLRRWHEARLTDDERFGLVRWHETAFGREEDELFSLAARCLSLAARSDGARAKAVGLALDCRLSSKEIDAALSPDGRTDLALARGLASRGEHDRACRRYELALGAGELRVPLHRARAAYARSLMATRRTEDALRQFDEALGSSPPEEFAETVRVLASVRPAPEDAASVADYWSALSERLPAEAVVLFALARAETLAGGDEAAFEHMLSYAEKAGDPGAFAGLARLAERRGELKTAAALAAQAAGLAPGSLRHRMLLARVLRRLGEREAAAASYAKALLLDGRSLGAARGLAAIELQAGRHDKAIAVWRRFLEAGGDAAAGHEALADIYVRLLDRAKAAEELEKALEARPGDERLEKKRRGIRP